MILCIKETFKTFEFLNIFIKTLFNLKKLIEIFSQLKDKIKNE